MLLAMLSDIQRCGMETKQLRLANQLLNIGVCNIVSKMETQASINDIQILDEFLRGLITLAVMFSSECLSAYIPALHDKALSHCAKFPSSSVLHARGLFQWIEAIHPKRSRLTS